MKARRKLRTTSLDSVRVHLDMGPGRYACAQLVHSIGDATVDQLQAILAELERGEARGQPS